MKQINILTSYPKQSLSVRLDNGKSLKLKFEYIESQIGWFFDVEYGDYKSTCHRLTNCPNLLRQSQNIYPFGLGCVVSDGAEPYFVDDFSTGRVKVFVLNEEEVETVEKEIYGKVL
jgi:hypothetical protein